MKGYKVMSLMLILSGVYGLLFLFFGIEGIWCSRGVLTAAVPVPVFLLWITAVKKRQLLPFVCFLLPAAAFLCHVFLPDCFADQLSYLLRCFWGSSYWGTGDVTWGVFVTMLCFSAFFFLVEYVLQVHGAAALTTVAFIIVLTVCGIVPCTEGLLLLGFYQLLFFPLQQSQKGGGNFVPALQSLVLVCGVTVLVFVPALQMMNIHGEKLFSLAEQVEIKVETSIRQVARQHIFEESRTVARGAAEPSGVPLFEVKRSGETTEVLYLRDFSGGNYRNGKWLSDRDLEIFERIKGGGTAEGRRTEVKFQNMYYFANIQFHPDKALHLALIPMDETADLNFFVYNGAPTVTVTVQDQLKEREFNYFEGKDMCLDWTKKEVQQAGDMVWGQVSSKLHFEYMKEAEEIYTALPVFGISRFRKICSENPKESLSEITAFIRKTLQEHAAYTMDPGDCPAGKDPVNYFFFENHKGYCQHFASAAVILYRLYGVPARYATGYAVKPADFSGNRAVVSDYSAHAWVEIFLEDRGWTPVEVTPGGAAVSETIQREFSGEREPEGIFPDSENEEKGRESVGDGAEQNSAPESMRFSGRDMGIGAGMAMLCSVSVFLIFYQRRRKRTYENMESRQLFALLLAVLHAAGCMKAYWGCEADFAETLAMSIPAISREEARRAVLIVERRAFGDREEGRGVSENPSDTAVVRNLYETAAAYLYETLSPWEKIRFRYVKGFLF